ncbi:MAG: 3'-5' exonuclease [Chitinophagales bacterium]
MLNQLKLKNALFFDIECVPTVEKFEDLTPEFQELWALKAKRIDKENENPAALYSQKAGIYAEFGKVICISAGILVSEGGSPKLRITSFADDNEKKVLEGFKTLLDKYFNQPGKHLLVGHNIKEFDIPYVCRRMLVHGIQLPAIIDIAGKKPWEIAHLDTLELWKFGDYKNYTSLRLLAALFDIPTPKDDIDGSQVASVYYDDGDLERIRIYCQKDVLTVVQLIRKYRGESLLDETEVTIAGEEHQA